jgi:hypothetical protein
LHFTDPTPNGTQISRFYSGDFHAQIRQEDASEKAFGERFQSYVDWVVKFVPCGRAVDIGCAAVLLPKMLRDKSLSWSELNLILKPLRGGGPLRYPDPNRRAGRSGV